MKIIMLLLLCTASIILTGCSSNNADTTYYRAGYSTDYVTTSCITQPIIYDSTARASEPLIWAELSALGVRVNGLHITQEGAAELLIPVPNFALIPSTPFGIVDEESITVLLDAADMVMHLGAHRMDWLDCIIDQLWDSEIWELFAEMRLERLRMHWTEAEHAMSIWLAELRMLEQRVGYAEESIWPGMIEGSYLESLAELGFDVKLSSISQPITIIPLANAQPHINTDDDVAQLLKVLFHIIDIGYGVAGINIDTVGQTLEEADLWPLFIYSARNRFEAKHEGYAHYIAQLADLGVVIDHSYRSPGSGAGRIVDFNDVWMPHRVRISINTDAEFKLTNEAELEMLVHVMELFTCPRLIFHTYMDIGELRQVLSAELWEQFEAISRTVRLDMIMQDLRAREQRVEVFLSR